MIVVALSACHNAHDSSPADSTITVDSDSDSPVGDSIVIYITADTLGTVTARDTDWCGHLGEVLAPYSLDVACLEGGVPPSSWTGESVTRTLFPQQTGGDLRNARYPSCDLAPWPRTVADALDGAYVLGADNPVIASHHEMCGDELAWGQGADALFANEEPVQDMVGIPEDGHPVHDAITDILDRAAAGGPVVAYLNVWEVAGHLPRCFMDPASPACDAMWQIAVDGGVLDGLGISPDADRADVWREKAYVTALFAFLESNPQREAEFRRANWGTVLQSVDYFRGPLFDDRITRLLDGLSAAGRLGDLVLVVGGDHGEDPCGKSPFANRLQCNHGELPTDWTANVPVYVVPASLATGWATRGFVGDADRPWSTVNVDYALLDELGIAIPADWPPMEPVGSASSWTCDTPHGLAQGVRVEGDGSMRCDNGHCGARTWAIPDALSYHSAELTTVPESLAGYASPNWFDAACQVTR
jgi:hypothetical protein